MPRGCGAPCRIKGAVQTLRAYPPPKLIPMRQRQGRLPRDDGALGQGQVGNAARDQTWAWEPGLLPNCVSSGGDFTPFCLVEESQFPSPTSREAVKAAAETVRSRQAQGTGRLQKRASGGVIAWMSLSSAHSALDGRLQGRLCDRAGLLQEWSCVPRSRLLKF